MDSRIRYFDNTLQAKVDCDLLYKEQCSFLAEEFKVPAKPKSSGKSHQGVCNSIFTSHHPNICGKLHIFFKEVPPCCLQ